MCKMVGHLGLPWEESRRTMTRETSQKRQVVNRFKKEKDGCIVKEELFRDWVLQVKWRSTNLLGLNNPAMRTEQEGRDSKQSWPKKVVRKWLNPSTTTTTRMEQLNTNYNKFPTEASHIRRRKSCSDKDDAVFMCPGDTQGGVGGGGRGEEWLGSADSLRRRNRIRSDNSAATGAGAQNHRMFVGTWNVGGRAPHAGLNLRDWLSTPAPADIYVLGFQEIVPLNAGNVLGTKDRIPAARWLSLIGQALNFPKESSTSPNNYSEATHPDQFPKPRVSFSDLISIEDMLGGEEIAAAEDEYDAIEYDLIGNDSDEPCTNPNSSDEDSVEVFPIGSSSRRRGRGIGSGGFCLAGSKQMVGIFLCVWIRADLLPHVSRLKASCVARGVMGYMGNKGSISISMTLRHTTFCFVCTHLTSGEKEKDEVKRNSDVVEILKRTRFPRSRRRKSLGPALSPKTILQHDKIIWLGDLNYRLTASCEETHVLLKRNDWDSLLEKDQLRIEQKAGRIFTGWQEGKIYFPPTYKYLTNSDRYVVQTAAKPRQKRRTPAWCDRILWRGEGMKQISYVRGESKFSDHRPVYSIFSIRVDDVPEEENQTISTTTTVAPTTTSNGNKSRGTNKATTTTITTKSSRWPMMVTHKATTSNSSINTNSSCARVQAEEMFPITRTRSCLETSRF